MKSIVLPEPIERRIYLIRGQKVMLDRDLASLYGVTTKVLNQAIKRQRNRFPSDFMFQLNRMEMQNWKSQIVTSNLSIKMGLRKRPYAFTEHGVAMLSSVLHSERAVRVNIEIIRAFVRLRAMISENQPLARRFIRLERNCKLGFEKVWDAIEELREPPEKPNVGSALGHKLKLRPVWLQDRTFRAAFQMLYYRYHYCKENRYARRSYYRVYAERPMHGQRPVSNQGKRAMGEKEWSCGSMPMRPL